MTANETADVARRGEKIVEELERAIVLERARAALHAATVPEELWRY